MCLQTFEGGAVSCDFGERAWNEYSHWRQHPSCVQPEEQTSPPTPLPTGQKPTSQTFLGLSSSVVRGHHQSLHQNSWLHHHPRARMPWIKGPAPAHCTLTLILLNLKPKFWVSEGVRHKYIPISCKRYITSTQKWRWHLCIQQQQLLLCQN